VYLSANDVCFGENQWAVLNKKSYTWLGRDEYCNCCNHLQTIRQ
jgi:hypothetical protein